MTRRRSNKSFFDPTFDASWPRTWALITPNSGTTFKSGGSGSVTTTATGGAVSHIAATTTNGYLGQINTTSAGNFQFTNLLMFRGAAGQGYGGFEMYTQVIFPDASYDNTGAATGSRIWGLCLASNATNAFTSARGGTQDLVGFSREHVNGSNTDTNWQFVTCDGTTTTVADTGVAFTVGKLYEMTINCRQGGTVINWAITNLTDGGTVNGSATATLPRTTIGMTGTVGVQSVDAVTRSFRFRRAYLASDVG